MARPPVVPVVPVVPAIDCHYTPLPVLWLDCRPTATAGAVHGSSSGLALPSLAVVAVVAVVVRLHISRIRPERRGLLPEVPLAAWVPSVQTRSVLVLILSLLVAVVVAVPVLEEHVH